MWVLRKKDLYLSTNSPRPPEGFDPTTRSWYMDAKAANGETIWTAPYIDMGTGDLVITAARGIYNNGKFVGVAGVDMVLNKVAEYVGKYKIGTDGYIFMTDYKGVVFVHPNKELIGKDSPVQDITDLVVSTKEDAVGSSTYVLNEEDNLAVAYKLPKVGLVLVGTISEKDIYATSNEVASELDSMTKKIMSLVVGLVLVLILLVSLGLTKLMGIMLKPRLESIAATKKLADGDLTVDLTTKDNTELKTLVDSINILKESLRGVITQLQNTSFKLEDNAKDLVGQADTLAETSQNVAYAIEDIAKGAISQAEETEQAASKVVDLSQKVDNLADVNDSLIESTKVLNTVKDTGVTAVKNLIEQSGITEA